MSGFFYDWWLHPEYHRFISDEVPEEYPCGSLFGDWNYHPKGGPMKRLFSSLPHIPSPIARFLRAVGAAALAAGIAAAIVAVKDLPIDNIQVIALLTAGLMALDKWCRDRGWY